MPAPEVSRRPRPGDWPERLARVVEEWRSIPFEYGVWDCVLAASSVVEELAEWDPAERVRGTYSDEDGAYRELEKFGGMVKLWDTLMGADRRIPVSFAQRGDVVVMQIGNQLISGVWLGQNAAGAGIDGVVFAPRAAVIGCWAV